MIPYSRHSALFTLQSRRMLITIRIKIRSPLEGPAEAAIPYLKVPFPTLSVPMGHVFAA